MIYKNEKGGSIDGLVEVNGVDLEVRLCSFWLFKLVLIYYKFDVLLSSKLPSKYGIV